MWRLSIQPWAVKIFPNTVCRNIRFQRLIFISARSIPTKLRRATRRARRCQVCRAESRTSLRMTTQKRLSLHFDIFSEIGRDVEIFAFDDSRLAFFKPTARDRLELQDFLFRLCRFFSRWSFFLYWRWLLVRYTYNRFRLFKDGYWFHLLRRYSL